MCIKRADLRLALSNALRERLARFGYLRIEVYKAVRHRNHRRIRLRLWDAKGTEYHGELSRRKIRTLPVSGRTLDEVYDIVRDKGGLKHMLELGLTTNF